MTHEIYEMEHKPAVAKVLKQLAKKLSKTFGVTVTGNRVTVRWGKKDGPLLWVHMLILRVEAGEPEEEERLD